MGKTGTIYIIKNSVNEKVYIGSTFQKLNKRMNEHRSRARRGKQYALYDEMRAVGIENFYITPIAVIPELTKEELYRAEIDTIKMYKDKANLLNTKYGIGYFDIEYIVNAYQNGEAIKKIAKDRGHCSKFVATVLRNEGVEIRNWNEIERIKIDDEELRRLYVDEFMTTPEIAEMYNTSALTIAKHLRKAGIQLRKAVNRKYLMPSSQETGR